MVQKKFPVLQSCLWLHSFLHHFIRHVHLLISRMICEKGAFLGLYLPGKSHVFELICSGVFADCVDVFQKLNTLRRKGSISRLEIFLQRKQNVEYSYCLSSWSMVEFSFGKLSNIWLSKNQISGRQQYVPLSSHSRLKRKHKYYIQVQGLVGVSGYPKSFFSVWTLKDQGFTKFFLTLHCEIIFFESCLFFIFKSYVRRALP